MNTEGTQKKNKGKGRFGDSRGHAEAGRKGGLARARKAKILKEQQNKTL